MLQLAWSALGSVGQQADSVAQVAVGPPLLEPLPPDNRPLEQPPELLPFSHSDVQLCTMHWPTAWSAAEHPPRDACDWHAGVATAQAS